MILLRGRKKMLKLEQFKIVRCCSSIFLRVSFLKEKHFSNVLSHSVHVYTLQKERKKE